jgi:hypothetical protein
VLAGRHERTPDADPNAAEHLYTLFDEGRRCEINIVNPSTSDGPTTTKKGVLAVCENALFPKTFGCGGVQPAVLAAVERGRMNPLENASELALSVQVR